MIVSNLGSGFGGMLERIVERIGDRICDRLPGSIPGGVASCKCGVHRSDAQCYLDAQVPPDVQACAPGCASEAAEEAVGNLFLGEESAISAFSDKMVECMGRCRAEHQAPPPPPPSPSCGSPAVWVGQSAACFGRGGTWLGPPDCRCQESTRRPGPATLRRETTVGFLTARPADRQVFPVGVDGRCLAGQRLIQSAGAAPYCVECNPTEAARGWCTLAATPPGGTLPGGTPPDGPGSGAGSTTQAGTLGGIPIWALVAGGGVVALLGITALKRRRG